jgi:hypothetical protein
LFNITTAFRGWGKQIVSYEHKESPIYQYHLSQLVLDCSAVGGEEKLKPRRHGTA